LARVVQLTGEVIRRNLGLFLTLALLINIPFAAMQLALIRTGMAGIADDAGMDAIAAIYSGILLFGLGYLVLQAAIIHATVADLNGRRPNLSECAMTGLREFPALFAIGVLYFLGFTLGVILLIVPGIIWAIMWCLAIPARVVESTGIFESFARSRHLTRGHRWGIFALFLAFYILQMMLGLSVNALTGSLLGPDTTASFFSVTVLFQLLGNIVSATISSVIGTVGIAALYYELRVTKEGIGPEALASVFD
jgi:hypothetical protein